MARAALRVLNVLGRGFIAFWDTLVRCWRPAYVIGLLIGIVWGALFIMASLWTWADERREHRCEEKAEKMQLEASYDRRTGCLVKTDAGWRPVDSIVVVEVQP